LNALKAIKAAIITRVVTVVFDRRSRAIFIRSRIVWGSREGQMVVTQKKRVGTVCYPLSFIAPLSVGLLHPLFCLVQQALRRVH
jgi:hypothetical protein